MRTLLWTVRIAAAALIAAALVALEAPIIHQVPANSFRCEQGIMQTLLSNCVQEHDI